MKYKDIDNYTASKIADEFNAAMNKALGIENRKQEELITANLRRLGLSDEGIFMVSSTIIDYMNAKRAFSDAMENFKIFLGDISLEELLKPLPEDQ